jgi:peptidoglycan/LPS O-acetylase OafA/YrhL
MPAIHFLLLLSPERRLNFQNSALTGTRTHYAQLDGLRGLAILLVMAYHFCLVYPGFQQPGNNILLQLAQGGWLGVDLFFVLSGFLITGILLDTRKSPHYFRNFLARRFLRIWPLYYLNLLILLVLFPLILPATPPQLHSMHDKQAWFWLYGANWLFARERGFGMTSGGYFWSLAVEEQFYVIWPFVVYWLSGRALLRACLLLLATSVGLRILLAFLGVDTNALYVMTFTHVDGLAVGSALAIAWRNRAVARTLVRFAPPIAAAALAGLLAVRLADGYLFFWDRYMARYGYTAAVVLFGALLIYVLGTGDSQRRYVKGLFTAPLMTSAGKYSYALYMVHVPVASFLYTFLNQRFDSFTPYVPPELRFLTFVVASFATSWLLAALSWWGFEKRILQLKRYFSYEQTPQLRNQL